MRLLSPVESNDADGNYIFNELRTMLDNLQEDMLAEQPDNDEHLEGVVEYQPELDGGEEAFMVESEELDPSVDDTGVSYQKKKESQSEDEEKIKNTE